MLPLPVKAQLASELMLCPAAVGVTKQLEGALKARMQLSAVPPANPNVPLAIPLGVPPLLELFAIVQLVQKHAAFDEQTAPTPLPPEPLPPAIP